MNVREPLKAKGLRNIGLVIVDFIKENKDQSVHYMHKDKFLKCFSFMNKAYRSYCGDLQDSREHLDDFLKFDCHKNLRQAVIEFIEDLPENVLNLVREKLSSEGLVSDRDNPIIKRYKVFVDNRLLSNDKTIISSLYIIIFIIYIFISYK